MQELLWLLLPVAAASGWLAAKRSMRRKQDKRSAGLSTDYYRGLNYLLNEEQDKALEIFIRLVEADSETIETHLALGGLFRRRGEVERSIRIHQNLLARPSLDQSQRNIALLELAKDYSHAGLLDRAESLFSELVKQRSQLSEALKHLLDIYQLENDWSKAIVAAKQLSAVSDASTKPVIAHYYCEIAVAQRKSGAPNKAIDTLKKALSADPKSVRANILLADINLAEKRYQDAYKYYLRVFELDDEFIPEVLDSVIHCIQQGVPANDFETHVRTLTLDKKYSMFVPGLTAYLYQTRGEAEALRYINEQLHKNPSLRSLQEWAELEKSRQLEPNEQLQIVLDALRKVMNQMPGYQCKHCGYPSTILHWQCPGCKSWSTIKPTARAWPH